MVADTLAPRCPCLRCSVKIVQTGVKEVVYNLAYSMYVVAANFQHERLVLTATQGHSSSKCVYWCGDSFASAYPVIVIISLHKRHCLGYMRNKFAVSAAGQTGSLQHI